MQSRALAAQGEWSGWAHRRPRTGGEPAGSGAHWRAGPGVEAPRCHTAEWGWGRAFRARGRRGPGRVRARAGTGRVCRAPRPSACQGQGRWGGGRGRGSPGGVQWWGCPVGPGSLLSRGMVRGSRWAAREEGNREKDLGLGGWRTQGIAHRMDGTRKLNRQSRRLWWGLRGRGGRRRGTAGGARRAAGLPPPHAAGLMGQPPARFGRCAPTPAARVPSPSNKVQFKGGGEPPFEGPTSGSVWDLSSHWQIQVRSSAGERGCSAGTARAHGVLWRPQPACGGGGGRRGRGAAAPLRARAAARPRRRRSAGCWVGSSQVLRCRRGRYCTSGAGGGGAAPRPPPGAGGCSGPR